VNIKIVTHRPIPVLSIGIYQQYVLFVYLLSKSTNH